MSKKDYQAVAAVINASLSVVKDGSSTADVQSRILIRDIARGLETYFRSENERFNGSLFREACETGACKGMPKRVA